MPTFTDEIRNKYLIKLRERGTDVTSLEDKYKVDDAIDSLRTTLLQERGMDEPQGIIGTGIDLLSRGNYAAAKVADVLINEEGEALSKAWTAVKGGIREAFAPEERLLFSDVIRRSSPVWSARNPVDTTVLGFIGDILLDPLTYTGFGAVGKAARIVTRGGKIIATSKPGRQLFRKAIQIAGDEGLTSVRQERRATEIMQEIFDPVDIEAFEKKLYKDPSPENVLERLRFNTLDRVAEGKIREGSGILIVDGGYLSAITGKGRLPGALSKTNIDKLAHAGEAGFSQEAVNRLNSGVRFFKITKANKVNPIANTVDAIDAKVNPGEIKFQLGPTGKVTILTGAPNKQQQTALTKFASNYLTTHEMTEGINKSLRSNAKLTEVSLLTKNPDPADFISAAGKKSRAVGIIFPPEEVIKGTVKKDGVGISRSFINPNIDIKKLRFVADDSDKVFTFRQLQEHYKARIASKKALKEKVVNTKQIAADLTKDINSVESLIDPGGLKFLGHTVISTKQFKQFANVTGLTRAFRTVKDLPALSEMKNFVKYATSRVGLDQHLEKHYPEWMRFRRHIEVRKTEALANTEKAFFDIFGSVNTKGARSVLSVKERKEVGQFMANVQKATNDEIERLKLNNPSYEFGEKIFRDMFSTSKLNKNQKAAIVKMRQAYNDMYRLENEASMLQKMLINYHPVRYEAVRSVKKYADLKRWQTGEAINVPIDALKSRTIKNQEDAIKAGLNPVMDAGELYLMRYLEHNAALRRKEWESFLKATYPTKTFDGKDTFRVPKAIEQDLVRLGEKFYHPRFGEEWQFIGDIIGGINHIFRASATIVRPAFAGKQVIGNFTQIFAEMGVDAMKVFSPDVFADAFSYAIRGELKFDMTDVFGIKYTAGDLQKLLGEYPVRKNVAIEGLGMATEGSLVRSIASDAYTEHIAKSSSGERDLYRGMIDLAKKGSAYLQIPMYIEDIYRTGTFLAALKAGHNPAAAMEIVDKALFNYTSGLTHFESQIRKHLIPFLSFQKFGATLLLNTAIKHPGRLTTGLKTVRTFFDVWNKLSSNEQLTEAERRVIPPFLIDQPHTFEGFTPEFKAKFKTFNNLAFWDVLGFIQVNDQNEFDPKATLVKGALAQMAPHLKVPLELIFQRKFFSDAALSGVYAGNIGNVDADKLLVNLSTMAGLHGGATTGGLGFGLGQMAQALGGTELMKKILGWEEVIEPNGERSVYVRPFMLHALTSFVPAFNTAIRNSSEDMEFWDKVLYTTFGINTIEIDLSEAASRKAQQYQRDYNEKLRAYRKYMMMGRLNSADVALEDLREFVEFNQKNIEAFNSQIRGPNNGGPGNKYY